MKVREIMTREVKVVPLDASVHTAAEQMRSLDVGSVPVCDGKKLQGMLTDRDIVLRAVAAGQSPDDAKVCDVMTKDVVWCFEDDEVDELVRKMETKKIRRIPVVNKDKELVGIVAMGDLATQTGDQQVKGRVIEKISERTGTKH